MSGSSRNNNELGEFLKARRAELTPAQVGLPVSGGGQRRVPGLRREEVAYLATISPDYYSRLEQGRLTGPSLGVLDALAAALKLTEDQKSYIYKLTNNRIRRDEGRIEQVPPQTQLLLDNLVDTPAIALGRCLDVLAWNDLAAALFIDFDRVPIQHRNFLRLLFLEAGVRDRYEDWRSIARTCVAYFRTAAAERPDDGRLMELVEDLTAYNPDFGMWWAERDVDYQTFGTKALRHPLAGTFALDWQMLRSARDDGQTILVMTAANAQSREAMQFLAAWTDSRPGGSAEAPLIDRRQ